jgi:arginine N-succinyltransferase
VRDSVSTVADEGAPEGECDITLVSNTKLDDFRMILTQACNGGAKVALSVRELQLLHCQAGDPVRTLSLNVRKNTNG